MEIVVGDFIITLGSSGSNVEDGGYGDSHGGNIMRNYLCLILFHYNAHKWTDVFGTECRTVIPCAHPFSSEGFFWLAHSTLSAIA